MSGRSISRRGFLASAAVAGCSVLAPRAARAEDVFTVGVVLPQDPDRSTELTRGAELGADDANALATLFGKRLRLETGRDGRALAGSRAIAIVAGVGAGGAEAIREIATGGTPTFNVGAADDRLRNEACERRAFHVIPSVSMYVDALGQFAIGQRKLSRWAVSTDGSARGAEIEAAARRAMAHQGGQIVPGGGDADLLLLAMEDRAIDAAVARAIAGGRLPDRVAGIGEAGLRLPTEHAAGLWGMCWHRDLTRFSGRELNARFRTRFAAPLTEISWCAWAALKLVGEAVVRGNAVDGNGLVAFIDSAPPFDGHKGEALTFRKWDHQLRQPLYIAGPGRREDTGKAPAPLGLLADVGAKDLDALGTSMQDSRCRFAS